MIALKAYEAPFQFYSIGTAGSAEHIYKKLITAYSTRVVFLALYGKPALLNMIISFSRAV